MKAILLMMGLSLPVSGTAQRMEFENLPTLEETRANFRFQIEKFGEHPWAGVYHKGGGMGIATMIAVTPQSALDYKRGCCVPSHVWRTGTATFTNGSIHLAFNYGLKEGRNQEYVPITWGARRYIIPPDEIIDFCNSVNQGNEPRTNWGRHLLREGDEAKPVTGFPDVPSQFRPYLLNKPIETKIVHVGHYTTRPSIMKWRFKDTTVTLDAGADQGLRVGMELLTTGLDYFGAVKITEVQSDCSEGIVTDSDEEAPGPQQGWQFSTRPSWY